MAPARVSPHGGVRSNYPALSAVASIAHDRHAKNLCSGEEVEGGGENRALHLWIVGFSEGGSHRGVDSENPWGACLGGDRRQAGDNRRGDA
jgi:hypothetical protein